MLIVIKNYLENTFLLQSFILVLLVVRFKGVDWAVKLFLRKGLRIHSRSPENDAIGNL